LKAVEEQASGIYSLQLEGEMAENLSSHEEVCDRPVFNIMVYPKGEFYP
jgi:hypothetical protein